MKPSIQTYNTQKTEFDYSEKLNNLSNQIELFLHQHAVAKKTLSEGFALYRDQSEYDLYGMIDAIYILHTIGKLSQITGKVSRKWAELILACQDESGWFTQRNLRGHSREHATAYAIGALRLLSIDSDENYVDQMRPVSSLLPLITNKQQFHHWITHLQFRYLPQDVLRKNVGWHHIWRGSHIGGGIAAIIHMTSHLFDQWQFNQVDADQWFDWYFDWLDSHANLQTGFWQRAFWNLIYRKPTLIDMGGAVHFFWIYEARQRPFPYPEKIIPATISLQKESGLYKNHPFCIDLDGNFCVIRSYLQLTSDKQQKWQTAVYHSAAHNFNSIIGTLLARPFIEIYSNSHDLPGALAALVECAQLPGFSIDLTLQGWQNPFDTVCWL